MDNSVQIEFKDWLIQVVIVFLFMTCIIGCSEDSDDEIITIIKDADGNEYTTVTIGTQLWLGQDLKTTKFQDGSSIPNVTDNIEWIGYGGLRMAAYCDYNNTPSFSGVYGRLYNWYAVADDRGLCPTGWHVPSDDEWKTLANYLGGADKAGGKLKETGTAHWNSPNTGATNSSGFTALPGGNRQSDGNYWSLGDSGTWWTSTEAGEAAWYRNLVYDHSALGYGGLDKSSGYCVRCLKD